MPALRHNRPMERGWDRGQPFVAMSRADVEALVGEVLPGASVVDAEPLTAGLRNTNYRLSFGDGSLAVLRLYTADPSACARETALLSALPPTLPVQRVLGARPAAQVPFAVLSWLPGAEMDDVLRGCAPEVALDLARQCGTTLASIHARRFGSAGFLAPDLRIDRPMPAWDEAMAFELDRAAPRLGPELSARVSHCVHSNARVVHGVWTEAALVHADFKPWNLLATAVEPGVPEHAGSSWRLAGVLDWEFACSGCRLIDFGTFLRDPASRPAGYADAFAAGYRAGGEELPAAWPRLMLLVDLLSLLQMAGRSSGQAAADLRRILWASLETIEGSR
jgi:Ser/Thr protein kinase RdoA (MazF antagonist)